LFKSTLILLIISLFTFSQTAGKMGAFDKAYKIICNISCDGAESEKLEQDDASEDTDFDALPTALNQTFRKIFSRADYSITQEINLNKHKTPETPPPDFINLKT